MARTFVDGAYTAEELQVRQAELGDKVTAEAVRKREAAEKARREEEKLRNPEAFAVKEKARREVEAKKAQQRIELHEKTRHGFAN
jgi:hypothetical protein